MASTDVANFSILRALRILRPLSTLARVCHCALLLVIRIVVFQRVSLVHRKNVLLWLCTGQQLRNVDYMLHAVIAGNGRRGIDHSLLCSIVGYAVGPKPSPAPSIQPRRPNARQIHPLVCVQHLSGSNSGKGSSATAAFPWSMPLPHTWHRTFAFATMGSSAAKMETPMQ